MRISALCTAVVTYVVIGHPPPAVAQVDQQQAGLSPLRPWPKMRCDRR